MTEEEFQSLLKLTRRRYFRWALWFMRNTGCRPGELADLEWAHVDWNRCCGVFHGKTTSRTGRSRVLVFPPGVMEMLHLLRGLELHDKWVFVNAWHRKYRVSALQLMLRRLRRRAGIPEDCKLYGLRHRYGTEGVVRGIDIKTLSELMGHSSVKTTEYYVHIAGRIDHLMRAAERLAE